MDIVGYWMSRRALFRSAVGLGTAWLLNKAPQANLAAEYTPPPAPLWLLGSSPVLLNSPHEDPFSEAHLPKHGLGLFSLLSKELTPTNTPPLSNDLGAEVADFVFSDASFNWHLPIEKSYRDLSQWLVDANSKTFQLRELTPTNLAECAILKMLIGEKPQAKDFTMTRGTNTVCAEFHFIVDEAGLFEIPHDADAVIALFEEMSSLSDKFKTQLHDCIQQEFDSGYVTALVSKLQNINLKGLTKEQAEGVKRMQEQCEQWLEADKRLQSTASCC